MRRRQFLATSAGALALSAVPAACAAPAGAAVRVAPGKRHLVDASGAPFFWNGDTCWYLFQNATREDAEAYLTKRRDQGFTVIQCMAMAKWHTADGVAQRLSENVYRQRPFSSGRLSYDAPNPRYWDHVDWIIRRGGELGLQFNIAPSFVGMMMNGSYACLGDEMLAAGAERMRAYGAFLGARYKDAAHITWLMCGDVNPPPPVKALVDAIARGIRDSGDQRLMSLHCGAGSAPADIFPREEHSWWSLNTCYEYDDVVGRARQTYARGMPFYLVESFYENENDWASPPRPTPPERIRRQAWEAVLAGACGVVLGVGPVWRLGGPGKALGDWKTHLASPGAQAMSVMMQLLRSLAWHRLTPRPHVVGAGACGAVTDNGEAGLVYGDGAAPVQIDLTAFSGARIVGEWVHPVTGKRTPAGNWSKSRVAATPQDGAPDWILVLRNA